MLDRRYDRLRASTAVALRDHRHDLGAAVKHGRRAALAAEERLSQRHLLPELIDEQDVVDGARRVHHVALDRILFLLTHAVHFGVFRLRRFFKYLPVEFVVLATQTMILRL